MCEGLQRLSECLEFLFQIELDISDYAIDVVHDIVIPLNLGHE